MDDPYCVFVYKELFTFNYVTYLLVGCWCNMCADDRQ